MSENLRRRINKAVNFAHLNCDREIDLDQLASAACLSKFHFSRKFSAELGETPIQFLQRLRLERSARGLVYRPNMPVTQVALASGFSGSQVFSRAFRRHFGRSPVEFRSENWMRFKTYWDGRDAQQDSQTLTRIGLEDAFSKPVVKVKTLPPARVAYMRHYGHYGPNPAHDRLFNGVKNWAQDNGLWTQDAKLFGVGWDNANITPPEVCRYDVCIPVPDHIAIPREICAQILPGGRFACISLDGHVDDFLHVWEWFIDGLLHSTNAQPADRPSYEIYHADCFNGDPDYVRADLCLALR